MRILEKIIHSVVPHPRNGNIPHLLRAEFVAILSMLVVMLFLVNQNNFAIIRRLNLTGAIYPAVLADMTNQDRGESGFAKLAWSATLEDAARLKAEDMITNGYFAHESPAGVSPWFWLQKVKYNFIYAGENLALDFTESEDVENAWLDSPTHRANVLSENFTEIGISAIDGNFEGRNTTFVVEYFGKPLHAKVAEVSTTIETTPAVKNAPSIEPEVAGASVEKFPTPSAPKTPVKIITKVEKSNEKFIVAQNTEAKEAPAELKKQGGDSSNMSAWYMRLAVNPTQAIKFIYSAILTLVTIAMALMLSKEYQKHHTKHLLMGVLLLALTGAFLYLMNSPSIIYAFLQA